MNAKRSPFLAAKKVPFALQCFAALKRLDSAQRMDRYLYNHIVSYSLYDPRIHTIKYACAKGNLEVLKYLVEQGVNIHRNGEFALQWSSACGHVNIVRYLVEEQGADIYADDNLALTWASENGHLDVVRYLLQRGASVHAEERYFFDDGICMAAEHGHLEVVQCLVEYGADINARANCCLRNASANGHLRVVKYLVEQGADIHDDGDEYPLKLAFENGHLKVVQYLLEQDK